MFLAITMLTVMMLYQMNKPKKYIIHFVKLFAIGLIFQSCSPTYIANVINTPMLSKKGDLKIAGYLGVSGFDQQAAYALTDNVGLMLNGSFWNLLSDSISTFPGHLFIEAGSGYYTCLGKYVRLDTYGGIGFGRLKSSLDNRLLFSGADINSMRMFIQPSIGFTSNICDVVLSSRFVMENIYHDSKPISEYFLEPVFTTKLGYEPLKFVWQIGVSFPLKQNLYDVKIYSQLFIFSMGLQYTIY